MKLKLVAFAFILAFAISTFGALGASGASAAGPVLTTPGTTVAGPDEALGGVITAFTATQATSGEFGGGQNPVDVAFP